MKKDYLKGLHHGLAIGIGYFAVSFSFGFLAVGKGISPLAATLISMTNLTSAGQFAGVTVIATAGTLVEMALIQFVINLRYALMGFSLSQKLPERTTVLERAIIAFGNTDEIFAVAMSGLHPLTTSYLLGLTTLPYIGWTAGTVIGALAGQILPDRVTVALGISLYGMLISIVMPKVRELKSVRTVVIISIVLSCLFAYVPIIKEISSGISIVICTVIASALGAYFFPIKEES